MLVRQADSGARLRAASGTRAAALVWQTGEGASMIGRLTDPSFEARFIAKKPAGYVEDHDGIEGAQGVRLRCPCGRGHWRSIGFANPLGAEPHPSCTLVDGNTHRPIFWTMSGSGLHDLTLSPSVDVWKFRHDPTQTPALVRDGSCWHGFITNGEVL